MADDRFPILGKGEQLAEPIKYSTGGRQKEPIRTFDQARSRLLPQMKSLLNEIASLDSDLRLEKIFFKVALDFEYLAKSYFPSILFRNSGWEFVGSRPWHQSSRDGKTFLETKPARLLFLSAPRMTIEDSYQRIERAKGLTRKEREDLSKIDQLGLQTFQERLFNLKSFSKGTLELIFHPLDGREWKECERKLKNLIRQIKGAEFLWEWKRGYHPAPIFLPAVLGKKALEQLRVFNPLRAARPMPSISFPRIRKTHRVQLDASPPKPILRAIYPEIGVMDGGADVSCEPLKGWVTNVDETSAPVRDDFLEHGTAVCGATLFGPLPPHEEMPEPKFRVKSFRVLPPSDGDDPLALYRVLDIIERIVESERNQHIAVYVMSFGPDTTVTDEEIDRFTVTLDQLAYREDVLFFVAVGNQGEETHPLNRIQPPSDLVNGVGVGAFTFGEDGEAVPTNYCCVGPGRPGSRVKPDLSAFGGSDIHPFWVLLPASNQGEVVREQGTSFSTPVAASVAGNLLYRCSDPEVMSPQTAKALMIHHAEPFKGESTAIRGWGALRVAAEDLMSCARNEVKVLYNGEIGLTRCMRLGLPFPEGLGYEGLVHFRWTIVYSCDVCPNTPDDYTLAGMDLVFRPNAHLYTYSLFGESRKQAVDDRRAPDLAHELEENGWRRSENPKSMNFKREHELREEGKWETVIMGRRATGARNVYHPVLDIHAIPRGDWERSGPGLISYAAAVSVSVSDKTVELYQRVTEQIRQLVPVRLRARARSRIM
jgi:hypothetical protein